MSDASLYAQLKERFAFDLPDDYKALRAGGWIAQEPPTEADADNRAMPDGDCLGFPDMEWFPLKEIASFVFPKSCQVLALVPFASTSAGDYWCWQVDASDQRGTRILYCPHDYAMATIHAPNLAAALYRQALRYASVEVDGLTLQFADGQAQLRQWSLDLGSVLPAAWCQVLADLAERTPYLWSYDWGRATQEQTSFLSPDERRQIEKRDLQFDEIDAEIRWMG